MNSKTQKITTCNQLHDTELRWFAVRVMFKREKIVLKSLQKKGITCLLPMMEVTRKYERKVKHLHIPLINHYVFVQVLKSQYISVLDTPDVFGFVRIGKDIISVKEEEMLVMQRFSRVQDLEVDMLSLEEWTPGMEVEIIQGSLAGLRGQLIEKEGKHNFVIYFESIGVGLTMKMDPSQLRPIQAVFA